MEALMRVCEAVADVATLEIVGRMLGIVDAKLTIDAIAILQAAEIDSLAELMTDEMED